MHACHTQRKTQKVRSYTFMLSELPPSQASGMLVAAIRTWVDKARAAEFQSLQSGETREDGRHTGENSSNSISPSKQKKQHGHSRSHSKSSTASHSSKYPSKEHDELLIGPRVTFLDEEDVIAPPPLPPKDARYQELLSPASLHSPLHSPSKKKRQLSQHHHHHQRRKSSDYSHQGHAVDVGLVWWESSLHGQRV